MGYRQADILIAETDAAVSVDEIEHIGQYLLMLASHSLPGGPRWECLHSGGHRLALIPAGRPIRGC